MSGPDEIGGDALTRAKHPPLEVVYVERARCPHCGGFRVVKYRSINDAGDGTSIAWVRCLDERCNRRFKIVAL